MTEMNRRTALECIERGRLGEEYLVRELENWLDDTPFEVVHKSATDNGAPFDVEIHLGDRPIVGIENKDLWFRNGRIVGTTIRKHQRKRKLEYAESMGINYMLTTITLRDKRMIGFHIGLVNRSIESFTFDMSQLVDGLKLLIGAKT